MSESIKKSGLLIVVLFVMLGFGVFQANSAVHFLTASQSSETTATETKSCWQQGYRLTFCSTGDCPSCTDESNGVIYFKKSLCDTTGYKDSCDVAGQILDPATKLACNNAYSLSCICGSEYRYGADREACDTTKSSLGGGSCTIGGKTYYKTCECSSDYSKICKEGVQTPASDECGGKYKACNCITPVVQMGQMCTQDVLPDMTCYVDCKPEPIKTCETEGYVTSCPVDYTGTSITANDGKLSCKTNCKINKYKIIKELSETAPNGETVYKIEALKAFGSVIKGDGGGYIAKESNLSQEGNSWVKVNAMVYGNAVVSGNALLSDNAQVSGNAQVYDNAKVYGDTKIQGNAKIYGRADIYGYIDADNGGDPDFENDGINIDMNVQIYGNAMVHGDADIYGDAGEVQIYGDTLIYESPFIHMDSKIYGNAEISGLSRIYGSANIHGQAYVSDYAWVGDSAELDGGNVYGSAVVSGNAYIYTDQPDLAIYDNAYVYGNAQVFDYSQVYGNAQVYDNAQIIFDAQVYGDAKVYGTAQIYDNSQVYGDAKVFDNAQVYDNSQVYDTAQVHKNVEVYDHSQVYGNAQVYNSTKKIEVSQRSQVCSGVISVDYMDTIQAACGLKYKIRTDLYKAAPNGERVYRIEALKAFGTVAKGTLGGWIAKEANLSQDGLSWVGGEAQIYANAVVSGDAQVYGNARLYGNVQAYDRAKVYDNAYAYEDVKIYGDAQFYGDSGSTNTAQMFGYAKVYGTSRIYKSAQIYDNAQVYGGAHVWGITAYVYGNAQVYGTADVKTAVRIYGSAKVCNKNAISTNQTTTQSGC